MKPVAVIDISSNELRLRIAQPSKNKLKYLEALTYPISLGRDTFDIGKISFEKVDKICNIIKNFLIVAAEYGISEVNAVATTAVREATNKDYILDQIKVKTSVNVQVLEDYEEKLLIYKLMMHLIDEELKKSAIMLYIGSGNVGISVLNDGKIPFSQNIKIGSMRISEIFTQLQEYSAEFHIVIEEYLKTFTELLSKNIPEGVKNFIASGSEISMIGRLCKAKKDGIFFYISKDKLVEFYNEIKHKSVDKICTDYDLSIEKAEVLLPCISIYYSMLNLTSATKIIAPLVFLGDSIVFSKLYPSEVEKINKEFNKNAMFSVREIAKRFSLYVSHSERIEKYAIKIFDKMKKVHGLGSREKLLLQAAAALCDIGKIVNVRLHNVHSYNMVKGFDIVSFSMREIEVVANICLYHSGQTPSVTQENYKNLTHEDRVLVSKLSAILRIADALERNKEHKFDDIDVKIEDDVLEVVIKTDKNTDLELWAFNRKGLFFKEVFGISPVLKKKRCMLKWI